MSWKRENGVERERGEDEVGMAKQGSRFWVDIGEREDEEERERACEGEGVLSGNRFTRTGLLNRAGPIFFLFFLFPWPVFINFWPDSATSDSSSIFSLFPPFKPIFRIYSKSAK